MRLLGISDLHVNHPGNAAALEGLTPQSDAWLIVAGDVCERPEHLDATMALLTRRFAQVVWVPGNHELWTVADGPRGLAKYLEMVEVCRRHDVLTPEDGWVPWPGDGPPRALVPLFLLYDYSFAPEGVDDPVAWAAEDGIRAADEVLLRPDPYPSRQAWCAARLAGAEALLDTIPDDHRTILVNHWPLRRDLCRIPRVPRYAPWCGTTATDDWHVRYRADLVVSGHLHVPTTDWRDGTRFEEVSFGYPRQRPEGRPIDGYLRPLLPGPPGPEPVHGGPVVHRAPGR